MLESIRDSCKSSKILVGFISFFFFWFLYFLFIFEEGKTSIIDSMHLKTENAFVYVAFVSRFVRKKGKNLLRVFFLAITSMVFTWFENRKIFRCATNTIFGLHQIECVTAVSVALEKSVMKQKNGIHKIKKKIVKYSFCLFFQFILFLTLSDKIDYGFRIVFKQ